MSVASDLVAAAVRGACLAEVQALKPGNVHVHGDGHGMSVADFEASADAIAPILAASTLRVGERILGSVEATRARVGCNTNLGIVLLCAPLAQAALGGEGRDLRSRLASVLKALDRNDADLAFRAIRLAAPGGLGRSQRHDVAGPATVGLREAMAEASDRDRVARQYVTDFADVFELGLPWLRAAMAGADDPSWAVVRCYLGFLGRFPDSHLVRKFGNDVAEGVRRQAATFLEGLADGKPSEQKDAGLRDFDARLKAQGLNPGTSADLTVASLLARDLESALAAGSGQPFA